MTTTTVVTVTYRTDRPAGDDALRDACQAINEQFETIDTAETKPGVVCAFAVPTIPEPDSAHASIEVCVSLDGLVGYANVERGYLLATRAVYAAGGAGLGLTIGHIVRLAAERTDEPAEVEAAPREVLARSG